MAELTADDWKRVLTRLSDELSSPGKRRIIVIGGVAMALGYGSRRTTEDADAVMEPDVAAEVLPAAKRIASEFGLPDDWLNQKAVEAGKVVRPQPPGRMVFETPTLVLEVPPVEHMLAMKVARFAGDTDIADATILLKDMRLRFSDVEDVWTQIGGFVPVAKRDAAHYYLHKLWEHLDESA